MAANYLSIFQLLFFSFLNIISFEILQLSFLLINDHFPL